MYEELGHVFVDIFLLLSTEGNNNTAPVEGLADFYPVAFAVPLLSCCGWIRLYCGDKSKIRQGSGPVLLVRGVARDTQ